MKGLSGLFASLELRPEDGIIHLSGERYLLVRAASLSREFFRLVQEILGTEPESASVAMDLAYDLAHAIGRSDARWFQQRYPQTDPLRSLLLGPAHFAYTGWGIVELDESSRMEAGPAFRLRYVHHHSFEADVWSSQGKVAPFPVCVMNAGYSAGWTSEVFGQPLSAVEIRCRAMGHDACRFVMAPPMELHRILHEEDPGTLGGLGPWKVPDPFLRQRMEQELRRSQEELERRVQERTEELRRLAGRLQQEILQREQAERRAIEGARWEASVRVAGGIAHDFNNLMGVVIGEIERLEALLPPGGAEAEILAGIQAGCRAAVSLSMQLLDFVRPGSPSGETTDAAPVIRQGLDLLVRLLPAAVRIEIRIPDHLGPVSIDPERLTRILTHLVLHARNRVAPKGRILVAARRERGPADQDRVLLEVLYEGVQVSPSAPDSHPGLPVDLAIAATRRLLETAGGSLSVEEVPDLGTRFRVGIPGMPWDHRERGTLPKGKAPHGCGEVILLVEDHLALQRLLHEVLSQAGYEVLSTTNPQEALQWLEDSNRHVDLLVTDVILPGIHGPELARRARRRRPRLKVLFMSGYPGDYLGTVGLHPDGLEVLQKPFTPSVLFRQVRRLLEER